MFDKVTVGLFWTPTLPVFFFSGEPEPSYFSLFESLN